MPREIIADFYHTGNLGRAQQHVLSLDIDVIAETLGQRMIGQHGLRCAQQRCHQVINPVAKGERTFHIQFLHEVLQSLSRQRRLLHLGFEQTKEDKRDVGRRDDEEIQQMLHGTLVVPFGQSCLLLMNGMRKGERQAFHGLVHDILRVSGATLGVIDNQHDVGYES